MKVKLKVEDPTNGNRNNLFIYCLLSNFAHGCFNTFTIKRVNQKSLMALMTSDVDMDETCCCNTCLAR